ncbi:MAG TPA: YceI family protein [Holophagaceae bacterium]
MSWPARLLSTLLLVSPLAAGTQRFTPDTNHTIFGFKASTLLFDVPGRFDRYRVDIKGDPDKVSDVSIRVELEAASIDTANATRDNHLRSSDFFDAAKYPKIVFTSNHAWKDGDHLVVQGTLTMHGVSKPIQIVFSDGHGLNGAGNLTYAYRASVPLNRNDFGIGADSVAAKISLRNEVTLNLMLVGFFH